MFDVVRLNLTSLAAGFVLICTLAGGCVDGNSGEPESNESCTPGRSVQCTCPDGSKGAQVCQPDGTFRPCTCSGDVSPPDAANRDAGPDSHGDADSGMLADGDVQGDGGDSKDSPHALKSVRGTSRFEKNVPELGCDGSKPEVKIIDENSDWNSINDSSFRIFCVKPGDYRKAGPQDKVNRIQLKTGGSKGNRRYLVYDGPSSKHPVNQKPGRRARVSGLKLSSGYWTIQGLWVDPRNSKGFLDDPVKVKGDAQHNIFDRMLVSPPKGTFVDTYLFQVYGNHTTLQNSVLRNTLGEAGQDRYCVSLSGQTNNLRLVSNELYDCTDGIQFTGFGNRPRFTGATIAHNDMYITPRYFSDGNGNRGANNSGDWTCAENAVDIKAGSKNPSNPVRVVGNRMWNFSDTDTKCSGSGSGPSASAIVIHNKGDKSGWTTQNIEVRNNIIFDVEGGIGVGWSKNVEVRNNLIQSFAFKGADSGFASKQGRGLSSYKSEPVKFIGNTLVDGKVWSRLDSDDILRNNVLLNAGSIQAKWENPTAKKNTYYGKSTAWEEKPFIDKSKASAAKMEKFCVTLRGYTDPRKRCFPNAVPTSKSPHGTETGFVPPTR